jgi:hypothetical protein
MIFKSLPFDKSSRRKEYFDFLNQPFHIGMVGLVAGGQYDNQEPFFFDWYGTQMLKWIKFTKDRYIIEFYNHEKFYKISNPKVGSLQSEYTFPHPRTLMDLLSDLDRCDIECEWSNHIIHNNDLKHILSNSDYKTYIDDLLNQIGKGKGMD